MPRDTLLRFLLQLWLLFCALFGALIIAGIRGYSLWSGSALAALLAALPWCFFESLTPLPSLCLMLLVLGIFALLRKANPLPLAYGGLLGGWAWSFFLLLLPLVPLGWVLAGSAVLIVLSLCLLWKVDSRPAGLEMPDLRQKGLLALWLSPILILLLLLGWNGWLFVHKGEYAPMVVLFTGLASLLCLGLLYALLRAAQFRVETLLDKQFQQELESFMQVIRSQRHDFNFHVQALSGMLEAERYDECRDYMQSLVKNVHDLNQVLPLYHPAISAMFNAFQEMAFRNKINMELRIENDLMRLPCTVLEVNTIMSNLLQNAIDETSRLPASQRWIRVLVVKRGAKNVIKISNPHHLTEEDFRHAFEAGHTTKQGHQGIGLSTVKRLVLRCKGSIHAEFEEGVVHFIVQLPIPLDA